MQVFFGHAPADIDSRHNQIPNAVELARHVQPGVAPLLNRFRGEILATNKDVSERCGEIH